MKLRHLGFSYNGNVLDPDQFAYVIGPPIVNPIAERREMIFPCRGGRFTACIIRITTGEPDEKNSVWHWDGNVEEPTITPSIGCNKRCGWHGTITKGVIAP